ADDVEERRLAGAVGADEPDEGTLPHGERHAVEGPDGAEGDLDAGDVEHPAAAGRQPPAPVARGRGLGRPGGDGGHGTVIVPAPSLAGSIWMRLTSRVWSQSLVSDTSCSRSLMRSRSSSTPSRMARRSSARMRPVPSTMSPRPVRPPLVRYDSCTATTCVPWTWPQAAAMPAAACSELKMGPGPPSRTADR